MKIRTLSLLAVVGILALTGCATTAPAAASGICPGVSVPTRQHGKKHRPGFTRCDDGRIVFADASAR